MPSYRRFIDTRRDSRTAPEAGVFLSGYRDDYVPESARLGVDPAKLGAAMRQADQGDTTSQQEIFSGCLEDPHVAAVLGKRIRNVLSRPLKIAPAIEGDERAQKAADVVQAVVLGEGGHGGIANLRQSLHDLAEALFRGFALSQIVWVNEGSTWRVETLRWWDQRDCVLGNPWAMERDGDADEVRVMTDAQQSAGSPLDPHQWVVHRSKMRSGPLARAALGRAVVWWWLFKKFAAKDWLIFCDRYGMPIRIGKYPRGASDDERAALKTAVLTLGKDAGATMPEGTSIELTESSTKGEMPYPPLIAMCDGQISKVLLGGTLTMEAGDRGARALGDVHERGEETIADDDGAALAETLRRDLFAPIVGFNLGWDYPVPECAFPAEEQENLLARAQRDKILIRDIGLPVTKRQLYAVYGLDEPAPEDEVVEPPKPQPSPFAAQPPADEDEDEQVDEEQDDADAQAAEQLANRLGLDAGDLRALSDAKKKSRAWVG